MPTPDASQFTQLKKYSAINTGDKGQVQQKTITHLYQPVPSVTQPVEFLASFSNKYVSTPSFVPINRVTGVQYKPKVPGGNVNGQTGGGSGGPICGVINITDIATYDSVNSLYVLNGNYTITACQILNIAVSITLRINAGQTLTNNGTINNANFLRNNGTFNNNGTLNNSLYVYNTDTLNNNGTFNNNTLGNIFNNPFGVFNNTSILNNTGNSYNDLGATINNSGFIYTYGGGITWNNGILNNIGTISTSDGSSTCGPGTLNDSGTINDTGTQNTDCPSSGVPLGVATPVSGIPLGDSAFSIPGIVHHKSPDVRSSD